MKKQRVDSKVNRKIILKEAAKGMTQTEIARKYGVTRSAVNKQFKRLIDQEAVSIYDNQLPQVLKTAAILHLTDSVEPAKRKKSSALQSATAGGICLTHLQGLPKTQINIQIVNQRLMSAADERTRIEQEIAELQGVADHLPLSTLNVIDPYLEPISSGCDAGVSAAALEPVSSGCNHDITSDDIK
jgi:DNA-binding MarR family transcriptional regulator